MSLAQTAVARHRELLEGEKRGQQHDHEQHRARYVELMLSGDESPEAARELAQLVFFLEDAEPPLTAEQVLADAAGIERAKRLMALHADLPRADAARREQASLDRAVRYLCEVWPAYQRRVSAEALAAYDASVKASGELQHLAERHPLFFDASGELPVLIGTEPASLARERAIDSLEARILRAGQVIREMNEILSRMSADHERRRGHELWKANREADHARLLDQLEELTGEPADQESGVRDQESLTPDACPLTPGDASPGFAGNQQDAARAVGISDETWAALKEMDGFPPRTKQGWDIAAIIDWVDREDSFGDRHPA